MRFTCQLQEGYISVPADEITKDEELFTVLRGGKIVAVIDRSVVLEMHLSEEVNR